MVDQYAVIGSPIAHSRSPQIHTLFAQQTAAALTYHPILGDDFKRDIREFFSSGGRGMNVTVPFKEQAWQLVDECSEAAELAQAVNTIICLPDKRLRGDNTDGIGLVRDLTANHNITITNQAVLLLGAGGAARGVLAPLLAQHPARLLIANRTAAKAEALASSHSEYTTPVSGCGLDALANDERFDLIIHATAAGIQQKLPNLPGRLLQSNGYCYDLMYGDDPTPFMQWGMTQKARQVIDGLGMLVEQAAESFYLWRGVRPDTQPVIQALRNA